MNGPLRGLRVIELAGIGPAPLACMLLADLGADVVRVDRLEPSGLGLAMAPEHDVNARGRRSVALDLKTDAGQDADARPTALGGEASALADTARSRIAGTLRLSLNDATAAQAREEATPLGHTDGEWIAGLAEREGGG